MSVSAFIVFSERQKSDTAADGVNQHSRRYRRLSAFFLFSNDLQTT
jgi:hypothetical protein